MHIEYRFWGELTPSQHITLTATYGSFAEWLSLPRARPTMILTAWVGAELVGYSLLTHDRLSIGGSIVDVAVIRKSSIAATLPDAAIVELVMTHAATAYEEGLGILLVRGDVPLWAKHGFAPVSYPVVTSWTSRPPISHSQPGTVVFGVPDAASVASISAIARARPISSVAVVESASPTSGDWLQMYSRDGQLRAAACIVRTTNPWRISQAVACDDGAASDLLDALIAHPTPLIPQLCLPVDHPVTRMALFSGATIQMHAPGIEAQLAGIIDLPAMLTALIPAFQARLVGSRYHDWVGGVRLEIRDERAMIMLNAGNVSVIDGTREAHVRMRTIELPALAQLCFGFRSVSALRRAGLLFCDDTELAILEILFPVLQPTFGWETE